MNEKAKEARREANRRYREAHRDELNTYRRKWAKENPDKIAALLDEESRGARS